MKIIRKLLTYIPKRIMETESDIELGILFFLMVFVILFLLFLLVYLGL